MMRFAGTVGLVLTTCAGMASAQQAPQPDAWNFQVGAGVLYAPAFVGSEDMQVLAIPDLRVSYGDTFFASVKDGVGYNVIHDSGWRIGPVAKLAFERSEDEGSIFRVAGDRTRALRGLGDVSTTFEAGGFIEYTLQEWSAKAEVRQGIGGHDGLVSDFSASHSSNIASYLNVTDRPIFLALGPRATVVDENYNQSYFGVDAGQSARSGLRQYDAGGGLLSYGFGAATVVPITETVSTTLLAGYDRINGAAADSPLVEERGSKNQGTVGALVTYSFGTGQ